ncbi:MAG: ABC transporter permease [Planctomycetes bacterium]|nr:ABC transporter permease [Planctomycetota bacterium]
MGRLALRNLFTKRLRTSLALLGVSVSIVGVIGLLSFSEGVRKVVTGTLESVPGIVVMQKNSIDPIFSSIPARHLGEIESVPGVAAVMPELWRVEMSIEHTMTLDLGMPFTAPALFGLDPDRAERFPRMGVYTRTVKEGRWLKSGDTRVCCISTLIAGHFKKRLGDTLHIRETPFQIVGVYDTGQFILNVAIIVPIEAARELTGADPAAVSSFYIEAHDARDLPAIEREIEKRLPDVSAMTMNELTGQFEKMMGLVDLLLVCISSVAVIVGAIGVVNTMLMSVMERIAEFGILKANGWTNGDVVRLVLSESLLIGGVGGILGCAGGALVVRIVAARVELQPVASPGLLGASFGIALVLGVLGGVYPAYRAARMNPIEAIRFG